MGCRGGGGESMRTRWRQREMTSSWWQDLVDKQAGEKNEYDGEFVAITLPFTKSWCGRRMANRRYATAVAQENKWGALYKQLHSLTFADSQRRTSASSDTQFAARSSVVFSLLFAFTWRVCNNVLISLFPRPDSKSSFVNTLDGKKGWALSWPLACWTIWHSSWLPTWQSIQDGGLPGRSRPVCAANKWLTQIDTKGPSVGPGNITPFML